MCDVEPRNLTKQALPSKEYVILLGVAMCVFGSNSGFVIEIVLRIDNSVSWNDLIDKTSGAVKSYLKGKLPDEIVGRFSEIVSMRNRIVHGYQITDKNKKQVLATKEKSGRQFDITEDYLKDFIRKNEELSTMLHKFRGY